MGMIGILVFGIGAQWLSWRLKSPSILFLLIFGYLAGPVTGIVNPKELFGESFHPFVSLSVAIILFEGGMTLKFSELNRVGKPVRNIVSVGILITWLLSTWAAWKIMHLSLPLASVLGAILVVTGPTVIMPMLRHLKLTGKVGPVLKWEAMINDPLGVILAVLVFEAVLAGSFQAGTHVVLLGVLKTIFLGSIIGALAGLSLAFLISRYWIPDFLQSAMTLTIVTLSAGIANYFQAESGLFAATIAGVLLANLAKTQVRHIMEFKENLRVLLISILFIILAAQLKPENFLDLDISVLYFFLFMVFVVRPLCVFVSTLNSDLNMREKLFLSWMAPRGIVAAATASVFALSLAEAGHAGAHKLASITFLMIIGTVLVYGLSAPALAYALKIAKKDPQGVLLFGARPWAQKLALVLKEMNCKPIFIDGNKTLVRRARENGLLAVSGNVLSEHFIDRMDLGNTSYFLALSPNNEANTLACRYFTKLFGQKNVYQLFSEKVEAGAGETVLNQEGGRLLFGASFTWEFFESLYQKGLEVLKKKMESDQSFEAFRSEFGNRAIIFFIVGEHGRLRMNVAGSELKVKKGETLIYVLQEETSD